MCPIVSARISRLVVVVLTIVASLGISSRPARAVMSDCGTAILSGSDWAGGQGVDVRSNGDKQTTGNNCKPGLNVYDIYANPPQWGGGWQCVELAARLYKTRNWSSGLPGVQNASDIFRMSGMESTASGDILWSHIHPGDMIVHAANEAGAGPEGHVALVDRADGNKIFAVEQNASDSGRVEYAYDEAHKSIKKGANTVRGIVHDPDNKLASVKTPLTVPDLYAINRNDAGSHSTAVHVVNGENWGQYLLNTGSALIQTDQTWEFALGDLNKDGKQDIWAFNRNPGGDHVVVHVLDGANPYHYLQASAIALPGVNQDWDFELGDLSHDRVPDIWAINRNTSGIGGHTVVHVINGANWGLYVNVGNIVLPPTDANWDFEVADYNGDGTPDIYAINRQDAGSNSTAVHVINGANWGQYLLNTGTALIRADQTWSFAVGDQDKDGKPDLWAVNRWPGGPHTVVHLLSGANFGRYIQAGNVVLPGTDLNFSFEVGSYN